MPTKRTKKEVRKSVRGWFVDVFEKSKVKKFRYFSGEALRNQARIYPTRKDALKAWPDTEFRTSRVLPCVITISYKITP